MISGTLYHRRVRESVASVITLFQKAEAALVYHGIPICNRQGIIADG